jgi:predicted DNA-binding transcriptional regulator YafY
MSEAATRALRLIDLVPFLHSHPGISLKDAASEFDVTVPQLVADLNLLFMCGLPGYTPLELIDLTFDDGYVVLRDPQNLATPRNFTDSELLIIKIALAVLANVVIGEHRDEIESLRKKIDENLGSQIPKASLLVLDDKRKKLLFLAKEAIEKQQKIEITYTNETKDQVLMRKISLIVYYEKNGRSFWDSWCHLSNARRTFNLDKVLTADLLVEPSEVGELSGDVNEIQVVIETEKSSEFFLRNREHLTPTATGKNRFNMKVFQREWIIREILSAAGKVRIVEPDELKSEIRNRSSIALSSYA